MGGVGEPATINEFSSASHRRKPAEHHGLDHGRVLSGAQVWRLESIAAGSRFGGSIFSMLKLTSRRKRQCR